uniref:Secreted protein n=1 Tax=Parascaris univalens TaxID=6257 RepID=A0A915A6C4_PARUN
MRQSEFLYPQRCGTTCYPGSLIILLSLTVLNTFIASGLISELMKVFFIALLKERSKESSRIPKRNGAKICIHKIGVYVTHVNSSVEYLRRHVITLLTCAMKAIARRVIESPSVIRARDRMS